MKIDVNTSLVQLRKPTVNVFEHEGRDLKNDNLKTARDIGTVRLNHSRLNVFTSLEEGDKEDHFKFKVASPGDLHLGKWSDTKVRIQILNTRGRIIADSEGSGRANEKYLRMEQKGEPFKPGDYFLRISRIKSGETTPRRLYSVQLSMGTEVKNDFDTKEYAAKPGPAVPFDPLAEARKTSGVLQTSGALDMMTAGLDNFNRMIDKAINIFTTIRGG